MNKDFFMPNLEDIEARQKWNEFNKLVNGNDADDFKVPIESIRYPKNGFEIERVGDCSSYDRVKSSRKVIAIVESNEIITVFTDDNENHTLIKKECNIAQFKDE